MAKVNPVYLIVLVLVILLVVYLKMSNPYRKFSTIEFWEGASVEIVNDIPVEAIEPGNNNGPVLMWAAMGASEPEILKALVAKGAQINEADVIFKGTPLTGAAGFTSNPDMISALIDLGADIHMTVNNGETALMIAARFNHKPGIISTLLKHGAKSEYKSHSGKTALDIAKLNNNKTAIEELQATETGQTRTQSIQND